jgi:general secretion pathway protein F/type IV pilus assembly protein PilC
MPDYTYKALNGSGAESTGVLTAGSEHEVMSVLDSQGLFPVEIALSQGTGFVRSGSRRKVKARHMAVFYGQLADLLHAGVPLLRSLEILERQSSSPPLQLTLREVRAKVADGNGLAEAMAEHPRAFNELAVSMIRAGQEGGFLEDVLRRIADFTDHQEDLKAKVVGSLAYPVFLGVVGTIVLLVLVMFFVPRFEPIFDKLRDQGELPWLTTALIAASHFLLGWWWTLILPVGLGIFLYKAFVRTEEGRLLVDGLRLKVPAAGTIYLSLALSRFTRIQGTLLQNGIPLLQALRIAKDSTGNRVLTKAIDQAADNVTHGDSLAAPLQACPYFPRDVVEMVAVGEESNNLEKVLLDIANALEKRTGRQLELFVRLLEPMMLLVMAGFTLIVVAGLLLPVFKMSMTVQ